jgi:hypothetical protein
MSRSRDEEVVPRAYVVRHVTSGLTLEEFFRWMLKTLASKMQLHGGAEFLDVLPIANVCFSSPQAFVDTILTRCSRLAITNQTVLH